MECHPTYQHMNDRSPRKRREREAEMIFEEIMTQNLENFKFFKIFLRIFKRG